MSKVDWITWKTTKEEIINPDNILKDIQNISKENHIDIYNKIERKLNEEISSGGLSKKALKMNGISPANVLANDILNKIKEIDNSLNSLQEQMKEEITNQKQVEKNQLIDELNKKITSIDNLENNNLIKDELIKKLEIIQQL